MIRKWKTQCDREVRGERALVSETALSLLPILWEANEQKIADAGGLAAWNALSADEQIVRNADAHKKVCLHLGENEFEALSAGEKREVEFLLWAGCCMHKEMNSVKGGNAAMMVYWEKEGLQGPVKLMNKDNAAAASGGSSAAQKRAGDVSQGGGVKAANLAGALFNHKDDKKGQQDTVRIFFESVIGYMIRFPDTSNTRYQSHCEAAAVLLVYLPLFVEFLELVRDKKETGTFNHMEQNVYKALHDIPTLTELCVLVLYAQAISHPYMRQVRGPGQETTNILTLGPLHEKVKAHIRQIIENPDLLLAPDASYESGALDGKVWERPEAFYAVQAMLSTLPHIRGALIAFFKGALETWERFTAEFASGGDIATASAKEHEGAFMNPCNDHNEGALGSFRVGTRRAPNMALGSWNSRAMYKKNGTREFSRKFLNKNNHAFIRKMARRLDSSGLERKRRQEQAKADREAAERKRKQTAIRKSKKDAANARIDATQPILDTAALKANPCKILVPELKLQLAWYRRQDTAIPKVSQLKNKEMMRQALIEVIERHNNGLVMSLSSPTEGIMEEGLMEGDSDYDSDTGMDCD